MVVFHSPRFESEMAQLHLAISKDSKSRADAFCTEILERLSLLEYSPLIGRPKGQNRREFIYREYVVPYVIKEEKIVLLGIYKANLWKE